MADIEVVGPDGRDNPFLMKERQRTILRKLCANCTHRLRYQDCLEKLRKAHCHTLQGH
jgi:hypothetical protein